MRYRFFNNRIIGILLSVFAFSPFIKLSSQVRFSRPDTTADYRSYRYFDECTAAISRLKALASYADPVWEDTISLDTLRLHRHLPEHLVEAARTCLSTLNVDTLPLKGFHEYAEALLVANRDTDVERMYQRLADSIKGDSAHNTLMIMIQVYGSAIPIRSEKMKQLYELGLSRLPADSVAKALLLRASMAEIFSRSGNHIEVANLIEEILDITDTLSDKYRDRRLEMLGKGIFNVAMRAMTEEASDSLAVSTTAFRNYIARVWKSLVGYEAGTEIGPYGVTAPEPPGHFYYSNTDSQGVPNAIQATQPSFIFEKGKVTIIHFLQGGCHSAYRTAGNMGRKNGPVGGGCWQEIHKTKKILEQYPNINLVVVSRTFGTIGDAPPLEPQQEADTLAQYFLGFHGLRGIHVVYKSDFIRLAKYDNRKIDIESEVQKAFQFGEINIAVGTIMIDELGQIFHFPFSTGTSEAAADAKLKIVMNRQVNRVKN